MILCFFNVFCYTGHLHFRANMNYFDDNVDTRRMGMIYVRIVPSKMQPSTHSFSKTRWTNYRRNVNVQENIRVPFCFDN